MRWSAFSVTFTFLPVAMGLVARTPASRAPQSPPDQIAKLLAANQLYTSATEIYSTDVKVPHRISIDSEYLEKHDAPPHIRARFVQDSIDGTLQKRQDITHHIQCETTAGSPLAADVISAGDAISASLMPGWEYVPSTIDPIGNIGRCGAQPVGMNDEWKCGEFFPNQYAMGYGVSGTANTGICSPAQSWWTCDLAGWFIRQIASECEWNGLAGGYVEALDVETSHPYRFMAFHS